MPANKRQHYVPRFYLRRFSNDGKSINLWNIGREKSILNANLYNQCYKNYFYGQDRTLEHDLSAIESRASQTFREISDSRIIPKWGTVSYFTLVFFMLSQYNRTLASANDVDIIADNFAKIILQNTRISKMINLDYVKIGFKNPAAYALSIAMQTYPLLLDLRFHVLSNRTNVPFITSDTPVVLYNPFFLFQKFSSNIGLAAKGLLMFLPMDPKHALLFYDHDVYNVNAHGNQMVNINRTKDIDSINGLQVCVAHNNIYFGDQNIDVERLFRENVHYRYGPGVKIRTVEVIDESVSGNAEMIVSSKQEIRKRITFRFLKTKFSATRWRKKYEALKTKPVVVVRNEELVEQFDAFRAAVKRREYEPSEFFAYVQRRRS